MERIRPSRRTNNTGGPHLASRHATFFPITSTSAFLDTQLLDSHTRPIPSRSRQVPAALDLQYMYIPIFPVHSILSATPFLLQLLHQCSRETLVRVMLYASLHVRGAIYRNFGRGQVAYFLPRRRTNLEGVFVCFFSSLFFVVRFLLMGDYFGVWDTMPSIVCKHRSALKKFYPLYPFAVFTSSGANIMCRDRLLTAEPLPHLSSL